MLFGTHGTSGSRAQSIVVNQTFNVSAKPSYAGPGAYFWEYEQGVPDTAKDLAELWWYQRYLTGEYKLDADPNCGIVGVELQDPEVEDVVDIGTHAFRQSLREVLLAAQAVDEALVHQLTAAVVDRIGSKRGRPVLLVKTTIRPPPQGKGRPRSLAQMMISAWPCFVVRAGGERLFSRIFAM